MEKLPRINRTPLTSPYAAGESHIGGVARKGEGDSVSSDLIWGAAYGGCGAVFGSIRSALAQYASRSWRGAFHRAGGGFVRGGELHGHGGVCAHARSDAARSPDA